VLLAIFALTLTLTAIPADFPGAPDSQSQQKKGIAMTQITMNSPVFQPGAEIPVEFTCEGENLSPALHWEGVPNEAKSLTLIAEDPDAPSGTFTHWLFFDLPANRSALPEGIPPHERPKVGGVQGTNDFGKLGYGGPCPPAGNAHRYFFKLYALDNTLGLQPGSKKPDIERAMKGHVLAQGELMGKYQRKGKAAA
jgi:Raf kinase inhibitor-like YbhB/YbcL family protein